MRLFLPVAIAIGFAESKVEFAASTLYDIYDFTASAYVHLANCKAGCLIYAATMGEEFGASKKDVDPYAKNLVIYDADNMINCTDIATLAQVRNGKAVKDPLLISSDSRERSIDVVNYNGDDKAYSSVVLYVVDLDTARGIASYQVYDPYYTEGNSIFPSTDYITFLSARPFGVYANAENHWNAVTAKLVGFDQVARNPDECPSVYQSDPGSSYFTGFFLEANPPILTLALGDIYATSLLAGTGMAKARKLGQDGFIASPGWNGCIGMSPVSFRTLEDMPTDTYILSSQNGYARWKVDLLVLPNFDSQHNLTIAQIGDNEETEIVEGRNPVSITYPNTHELIIKFENMKSNQGFILTYSPSTAVTPPTGQPTTRKPTTAATTTLRTARISIGTSPTPTTRPPSIATTKPTLETTRPPATIPPTTARITTRMTTNAPAPADRYCNCGFKDGWFDDWDAAEIWVDLIVILDTSASMGDSLEEAKSLLTSFIGLMSTDTANKFYSRIGVIAASDKIEVVYNLNMSSADSLDWIQQHPVDKIDVGAAFQAALQMFADGMNRASYRENARQIVYYLTNSAPGANLNGVNDFKTSGGIVIVNDFVLEGDIANPNLMKLASDNFFFTDLSENYLDNLGVLCEANCYCAPTKHAFNDDETSLRTQANRGCFHPVNSGIPQQKARETCQREAGASLVSIHDEQKEFFVSSVVSIFGAKKKYWLGLQNDGNSWIWDDQSTNPYSDWDDNQPDTHGGSFQCTYATQTTGLNVRWTAANCAMGGVVYVCESAPCSVGNTNC